MTTDSVEWADAHAACAAAGHVRAGAPANGRDNALLRTAADAAGAPEMWLAYAQNSSGTWTR